MLASEVRAKGNGRQCQFDVVRYARPPFKTVYLASNTLVDCWVILAIWVFETESASDSINSSMVQKPCAVLHSSNLRGFCFELNCDDCIDKSTVTGCFLMKSIPNGAF